MSKTIVGVVKKVEDVKGEVVTDFGTFGKIMVHVEDANGVTKIQKLIKPGSKTSQGLVGKKVQVTFEEKQVKTKSGEEFTARSASSKNWVVLDFNSGNSENSSNTSATEKTNTAASRPYNSDGARHGMIVNNAINLATALKINNTDKGLKQAAMMVLNLTKFVEAGCVSNEETKTKTVDTVEDRSEESENPF